MTDRASWAVGDDTDRRVGTEEARLGVGLLTAPGASPVRGRSGLRPAPGDPGKVSATTPTPGSNVTVNAFQGTLNASRGYGTYLVTTDTTKTVSILNVPAHGSLVRHDLIVAQQSDVDYLDGNRAFWVGRILGVPGAGDPTVDIAHGAPTNSPDYVVLSRVRVTAGASAITAAMIDDLRPPWVTALGGLTPVRNQAERDTLPRYPGQPVWRLDTNRVEVDNGTQWMTQGVVLCTSASRPGTGDRYTGMEIFETDTKIGRVWDGSAWRSTTPLTFDTTISGDYTIPSAGGLIPGATVSFSNVNPNAVVMVSATFDWELTVAGTGYCYGRCYIDGAAAIGGRSALFNSSSAGVRFTGHQSWRVPLSTSGAHTVRLWGQKDVNFGTAIFRAGHTTMQVTVYD